MDAATVEKEKYQKAWNHEAYRNFAPGEQTAVPFVIMAQPEKGSTVTDFGAGTGRGSLIFHRYGLNVTLLDIADNCLDERVKTVIGDKLTICNLWDHIPTEKTEYGYCTDVMEHIPTEYVDDVLNNIFDKADKVFLQISLVDDHFGEELGESLHLTVRPFWWWKEKLSKYGKMREARDLVNAAIFYITK